MRDVQGVRFNYLCLFVSNAWPNFRPTSTAISTVTSTASTQVPTLAADMLVMDYSDYGTEAVVRTASPDFDEVRFGTATSKTVCYYGTDPDTGERYLLTYQSCQSKIKVGIAEVSSWDDTQDAVVNGRWLRRAECSTADACARVRF